MDLNDVRSLVTLAGLTLFVALAAWTWRPALRRAHEDAAQLPFAGENDGPAPDGTLGRSPEALRAGSGEARQPARSDKDNNRGPQ